jgi:hypothetical protein
LRAQVCSSLLPHIRLFCRILPYMGLFWSIKGRCTSGLFCCI